MGRNKDLAELPTEHHCAGEQVAPLERNGLAALNFTPISESGKQKLQDRVAPSRSTWENFCGRTRIH